eukprot:1161296-Pelagomonas_calceolata.AAC.1
MGRLLTLGAEEDTHAGDGVEDGGWSRGWVPSNALPPCIMVIGPPLDWRLVLRIPVLHPCAPLSSCSGMHGPAHSRPPLQHIQTPCSGVPPADHPSQLTISWISSMRLDSITVTLHYTALRHTSTQAWDIGHEGKEGPSHLINHDGAACGICIWDSTCHPTLPSWALQHSPKQRPYCHASPLLPNSAVKSKDSTALQVPYCPTVRCKAKTLLP